MNRITNVNGMLNEQIDVNSLTEQLSLNVINVSEIPDNAVVPLRITYQ